MDREYAAVNISRNRMARKALWTRSDDLMEAIDPPDLILVEKNVVVGGIRDSAAIQQGHVCSTFVLCEAAE